MRSIQRAMARGVLLMTWAAACGGGAGGGGPDAAAPDAIAVDAPTCDPTVRSITVPDLATPTVGRMAIQPDMVNPAATAFPTSIHQVFVPTGPGVTVRDELFVILPGTNNLAQGFETLATLAARSGYRVVSLAYESDTHPIGLCAGVTPDQALLACREGVWSEKAYGLDVVPQYPGDVPNSISGRLVDLLRYVDTMYPNVGADAFFTGTTVRWDRVVLLGFSQGSVLAGYIGRDHALARLILVAGGCDDVTVGGVRTLTPWCSQPRMTPAARTVAISHINDEANADALVAAAFGLLGADGYADISTGAPGYCSATHALLSHEPTAQPHLSLALDGRIPLQGGIPTLAEDYYYAFAAPLP